MAEKPEELNLPTSSVVRIVKESVSVPFSRTYHCNKVLQVKVT